MVALLRCGAAVALIVIVLVQCHFLFYSSSSSSSLSFFQNNNNNNSNNNNNNNNKSSNHPRRNQRTTNKNNKKKSRQVQKNNSPTSSSSSSFLSSTTQRNNALREFWLNVPLQQQLQSPKPQHSQEEEEHHHHHHHYSRRAISPPPLELVHIPKTGGTSLELAAAAGGIPWSYCHHNAEFQDQFLPFAVPDKPPCPQFQLGQYHRPGRCSPFHLPPSIYMQNPPPPQQQQQPPPPPVTTQTMPQHEPEPKQQQTSTKTNDGNGGGRRLSFSPPPSPHYYSTYYHDSALFAVVRNPYDRIVSEFGHIHRHDHIHESWSVEEMERRLNEWIRTTLPPIYVHVGPHDSVPSPPLSSSTLTPESLLPASNLTTTTTETTTTTVSTCPLHLFPRDYFKLNCHLIPQVHYIFPLLVTQTRTTTTIHNGSSEAGTASTSTTITTQIHANVTTNVQTTTNNGTKENNYNPNNGRMVHHVLYFEHLAEDLPRLLQWYNLHHNITLPPPSQPQTNKHNLLNASLISESNKRLIQQVYRQDFELFGFAAL